MAWSRTTILGRKMTIRERSKSKLVPSNRGGVQILITHSVETTNREINVQVHLESMKPGRTPAEAKADLPGGMPPQVGHLGHLEAETPAENELTGRNYKAQKNTVSESQITQESESQMQYGTRLSHPYWAQIDLKTPISPHSLNTIMTSTLIQITEHACYAHMCTHTHTQKHIYAHMCTHTHTTYI